MADDNRKRDMEKKRRYMRKYNSSAEQKKVRAERNRARRKAMKEGKVTKGDGKDVHHVRAFAKGGDGSGGTKVVSRAKNRGHKHAVRKG